VEGEEQEELAVLNKDQGVIDKDWVVKERNKGQECKNFLFHSNLPGILIYDLEF
jgi:hypothetical protein